MVNRTTFSHLSTPPLPGGGVTGLMQQYSERFKTLFDASALPLSTVAGTANAVTAVLDPPLDGGGLVDGMKFEITWGAANTAGVTLAINGGSALSVLDAAGAALIAGAIGTGLRSLVEYIGGSFRILSPLLTSLGGGAQRYYWQFTASGTWIKPAGLDDDTMVFVEAWGGGGGGHSAAIGGGGGGGGWMGAWFRAGDLPSSVAVTVGPGGAVSANGSNSTFGSLLTAFAGLGSTSGAGARAGGGATGGRLGAGIGGASGSPPTDGGDASQETGGGGGGGGSTTGNIAGGTGGFALRGGGGGGGARSGSGALGQGGTSIYGGNGGGQDQAGVAPGGGGGRNAAGARGEVRVWM